MELGPSVVSFFSGCGGLDLGFVGGFVYRRLRIAKTDFRLLAAYDFSQRAVDTYIENLGAHASCVDLARADVRAMPAAEVLLGGFPCQEFSRCGPRRGLESDRGKLYKAMVRYAKAHKPKLVVAENVADLLYINGGWDFGVIKKEFSRIGYRCETWEMNAADYGVPQNRRRVFVIFVRSDLPTLPSKPKPTHHLRPRTSSWAIRDLTHVRDESVPNQSQFFKAACAGRGHGQGDERTPENAPAFTVRANAKSRIQFHYSLKRRLTVRECARIQTFPDSFVFPFAATENIRQIGNAVPPLLGNVVALALQEFLRSANNAIAQGQGKRK